MDTERPFPLMSIFRRRVIPVALSMLLAITVAGGVVASRIAEDIYLNLARVRAQAIVSAVQSDLPGPWEELTARPLEVMRDTAMLEALRAEFAHVIRDSRIQRIKVYEPGGRLIIGGRPEDTGILEATAALRRAFDSGEAVAVRKSGRDAPLYELYIPVADIGGVPRLVFEIYEPAGFLDRTLVVNALPSVLLPTLLLSGLLAWLSRLVRRAQHEIDHRTTEMVALRQRLERFVSSSAKGAVRGASADGAILPSRLVDMTLFYSDVVDFTGYSENHPPQRVVDFLNHLMAIQIEELHRHGGDVDKMIGDALLACFEGPDRAERAVAASKAILERLVGEPDLPRTIRIGLHDGHVISGTIGPQERQDFTVIGDSVNVAARLCSAARSGELLADQRTIARAGHPDGFGPVEEISVKGRRERLEVRRWAPGVSATPS